MPTGPAFFEPSLAGLGTLVDLTDEDGAVEQLLDMDEEAFDAAVVTWLLSGRVGTEIMRDYDVVERTYDALCRLRDRLDLPELAGQVPVRPELHNRLRRAVAEERPVAKREAHEARLERERDVSLNGRALNILKSRHPTEFRQIKRNLQGR
jgi:hypothetical protein